MDEERKERTASNRRTGEEGEDLIKRGRNPGIRNAAEVTCEESRGCKNALAAARRSGRDKSARAQFNAQHQHLEEEPLERISPRFDSAERPCLALSATGRLDFLSRYRRLSPSYPARTASKNVQVQVKSAQLPAPPLA